MTPEDSSYFCPGSTSSSARYSWSSCNEDFFSSSAIPDKDAEAAKEVQRRNSWSSADIPLPAHWSHVPAPPIQSVPLSVPLQRHQVDGMHSQLNRSLPIDTSGVNNQYNDTRSSTAADGIRSLLISKDAAPQFPDELGLEQPPSTNTDSVQTIGLSSSPGSGIDIKGTKSSKSSSSTVVNASESGSNRSSSSNSRGQTSSASSKPLAPQKPTSSGQQYQHQIGHADQQGGGASQTMAFGGEWHRRMGYHGRKQTSDPEKNFASSKVKQIYVAKLRTSGNSATG